LAARDRFIAQRIAATLAEGETGLLFLGAAHRLDALRALGIAVRTLHRIG
jgi:pheromone shutdown protein TraB